MKTNRRSLLKSFLALPFVAPLMVKAAAKQKEPVTEFDIKKYGSLYVMLGKASFESINFANALARQYGWHVCTVRDGLLSQKYITRLLEQGSSVLYVVGLPTWEENSSNAQVTSMGGSADSENFMAQQDTAGMVTWWIDRADVVFQHTGYCLTKRIQTSKLICSSWSAHTLKDRAGLGASSKVWTFNEDAQGDAWFGYGSKEFPANPVLYGFPALPSSKVLC